MFGTWGARVRALVMIVGLASLSALFGFAQPASAAPTPKIKVSIVHKNAGTMKVTGTNFPKNSVAVVHFDQNAGSGDLAQDFNVRVTGSGKFTLTAKVFISAACSVGVFASDADQDSNFVSVNTTGKGCKGGAIKVDPCGLVCGDFGVTGTGFTPTASVDVDFFDGTSGQFLFTQSVGVCGTLAPGPYPGAPTGQLDLFGDCKGFVSLSSHAVCGRTSIRVVATEIDTDYEAPAVTVAPRC
jgi:hypothetical protein